MVFYNPLFIAMYGLALKSKSNRDMPIFPPLIVVTLCLMFNVFAVMFLLEGFQIIAKNYFLKEWRLIGTSVFLGLTYLAYGYRGRGKRIFEKYKAKRTKEPKTANQIFISLIYFLLSGALLLLAALFKNKDWIFS